jgi:predicted dehydrogenase
MSAGAKLRAAVAGVGYFGRLHAQKLAANTALELVAVADRDAARAEAVAREVGCRAVRDVRELAGAVDLCSVTVPTEAHHEVAGLLIESGVHVLIEKPIAETLAQADDLLRRAAARGVMLGVGHQERFNPAFVALREGITRALFIEAERLAPFKPRGVDVDVVLDLMIHDLDLVLALAGADPVGVSACGFKVFGDAVDIASARLEFADGSVASLSASRVSQSPVRKLRVFQQDLYASADLQAGRLRSVSRARDEDARILEVERAFDGADALRVEIDAFVAAVREGRAPPVTGEDGRRTLKFALEVSELVHRRLARLSSDAPGAGG